MTGWAITFLVLALAAAALAFSSRAGDATWAAWSVAAAGIVIAIVLGVRGRKPPE